MTVQVGKEAPDFRGQAFHGGVVREVGLSDYRGQWVLVFFYPADFTVV
jgi:peroxiredoxin (alkyl hydroperoxide reductase subunit C)